MAILISMVLSGLSLIIIIFDFEDVQIKMDLKEFIWFGLIFQLIFDFCVFLWLICGKLWLLKLFLHPLHWNEKFCRDLKRWWSPDGARCALCIEISRSNFLFSSGQLKMCVICKKKRVFPIISNQFSIMICCNLASRWRWRSESIAPPNSTNS